MSPIYYDLQVKVADLSAKLVAAKSRIGELEQALREIGKHTMESEDDIDFIIDACHAALRGAQP